MHVEMTSMWLHRMHLYRLCGEVHKDIYMDGRFYCYCSI